jgi:hypothetical protein
MFYCALLAFSTPMVSANSADAKVIRIVIDKNKSESPAYGGKSFGNVGPYERIVGQAYGEIDPNDIHNLVIQDIQLAPRNSRGMVEYIATFTLLKPIDLSKGSNVMLYEVVNRGRKPRAERLDLGYTYLYSGWQGDIPPDSNLGDELAETIRVPIAKNPDGSPISGPVLARIKNTNGTTAPLIVYYRPIVYSPLTLDTTHASLTSRKSETIDGTSESISAIPSTDWAWADCTRVPFPGTPDPTKICLKNGFDPKLLYQVVFTAKDPLVLGIGFAATRDIVAFFRRAEHDDAGTRNPLGAKISYVISQGASQSGNFVRSFINLGFNEDESGRIVWDGAMPHIAGRQMALNIRFALPDGAADLYEPGSDGAVWWTHWPDKVRDRKPAGLLDRCSASHNCPKIIETFGSTEFWALRMSPDLVGTEGTADIPLPDNVRRYYFPGTTHGGGNGGFSTLVPAPARGRAGVCELPANPNPQSDTMNALLAAMVAWVVKGTPTPPSQYPLLKNGDLVAPTRKAMGFPIIPGLTLTDNFENPLMDYDWGSDFKYNDVSGIISNEPPSVKKVIPLLIPKVNPDGNEIAGVPSVLLQAPLGTYLGWNLTATGFFKGHLCAFTGGYVPFAKTQADRMASDDPRLSLQERYSDHDGYVAAVRAAAEKAVSERFLLKEDADRLIRNVMDSDVLRTK